MASQPESKIPGPGGGGGGGRGEKRRSFLPAPKRSSAIPGPASSAAPAAAASLRSPAAAHKEWAREEEAEVVPGAERLTVGGRILISGVKPGILRFVGKTHIAPGFWCGIELFDASGLHDGEVDGKRYFTCKPFRGIFAPLDKVLPDESHPSPTVDEKRSTISEKLPERDHAEKQGLEPARKAADYESSKIPAPGKSQTVRQSGIPRIGSGGQDKGVARSASSGAVKENASKIATLSKRSTTTEDATAGSNVSLNSTFVLDGKQTNRSQLLSEDSDGDDSSDQTYSCRIEKRLQSDSRQYFNITFNKDNPPSSIPTSNLPDVVSSASPSPPRETAARAIPGTLKSAQDTTSSIASDISLGLMDPDIIADETNLLEGIISGKVASSASESDISQSGNSSTLEDTSVATVNEAGERGLTSTPLQGVHFKQFLEENGESLPDHLSDAEGVKAVGAKSAPSVKQGLSQTFAAVARDESARRKDSTSSTNGVAPRVDLLQEEGSNGVSPEVSQVLEWDYDHDAFDGVPGETVKEKESDSDVHRDATMVDNTQTEGPADGGDLDRTACHDESEESEDGEEEEESDSSEVETSEEEEEEDEEEEEEEDEEGADDRPEDDRIEADRVAPSGAANAVGVGSAGPALASGLQDGVGSEMTESAGPSVADLTGSSVGSEMTESADPACGVTRPSAEQQGGGGLREVTPAKSEGERSSNAADESGNTSAVDAKAAPADGEGDRLNRSSQAQKKRKSSASTSASRKAAAEHKKAVKAVSSRLADYIKAPLPPAKPKEEKKAEHASQKNQAGKTNKAAGKKRDNGSGADKPKGDGKEETKREKRPTPVKEEKPKVKRTAPKSKWGNIMSQIEANKDTVKIKPKAEIKSSLAVYLSTPVTASNTPSKKEKEEEKEPNKQKDEAAPKSKLVKLVKHPKPDFSNIKSKLNITSPPKLPKARERSASPNSGNPNDSEKPANRKESRTSLPKKPAMPWLKKKVLVDHHVTPDNCSTASQGSCADLSGVDGVDGSSPAQENKGNTVSCSNPRLKNERASSVGSSKSDMSNAQRSTKTMNLRNAQKSEAQSTNSPRGKKSTVKSSIPPPNQGRNRGKAGSGLKSGHPPDVVSTSARGSRAQEVARLESLCEARTKELNVAKMQLKAGLQAFDAVTCLLNYCTNQLDAFSCPAVTASLHTAEAKLLEQQQQLECLGQQKIQLEQQLQELTAARDAALHDVTRLQQEMTQAEETHSAAQQRLQEEHAAALNDQQEQLTSQHQQTVQQLQSYSEKQADYTHQSHKRQLAELAAEHQMATNQLKVAHLEEIQELRNKHDLQMEELHAQHRNKLEDITRRFESIKLSLSEKVQSLCVECDELRFRAKTSEDALQRDADVKVQMALAPYLNLPQEIESLRTVIDMRTEEIQKLRRQNMDLEKQLEELPIAQEKVVSLQQKVENLQAIINIKTDHEKQLHEKCQVLMRKYDRESRANKRLSMDYEQVVWRMSQSADFSDSVDSLTARQLSHSPTSGDQQQQQQQQHSRTSPSPVRRTHSSTPGADNANGSTGVTRRQRRISAGDEDYDRRIRCRSATFSLDKSRGQHAPTKGEGATGVNGTGSSGRAPSKLPVMAKSGDYTALIVAAMDTGHDESFSSGHESGDTSDFQSSMESSVILETAQGLSYNITVADSVNGVAEPDREASTKLDDVFVEEACVQSDTAGVPADAGVQSGDVAGRTDVTVVVVAPSSE